MFDTVISYDAITSLENLFKNEQNYKSQMKGEIQSGSFLKENELGFSSFCIDLRSNNALGETCCMLSACYFKGNLLSEAKEYVQKAIELCPDREDFKKLEKDIKIKRNK